MSISRFGSKEAECFYVDINLSSGDGSTAVPINKDVSKGIICLNPEDYYVAVNRLQLSNSGWLWSPLLKTTGQTNPPVKTAYTITISADGFDSDPTPIELIRTNLLAEIPVVVGGNLINGQPQNDYAAVYEYSTLTKMFQNAFSQAWLSLIANAGGSLPSFPTAQPPQIIYNQDSGRFTLQLYPYPAWFNAGIQIWFSSNFRPYLKGWALQIHADGSSSGKDILLITDRGTRFQEPLASPLTQWTSGPPGFATIPQIPSDPTTALLLLEQSYSAMFVFNSITSIQLQTNLPIIQENTDPDLQSSTVGAQQYNFQSILTDFIIDASSSTNAFAQPLVYNANGVDQSRIIKLTGSSSIQQFNIKAVFIDSNGISHPITSIGGSQPASVKLAFYHRKLIERYDSDPLTH